MTGRHGQGGTHHQAHAEAWVSRSAQEVTSDGPPYGGDAICRPCSQDALAGGVSTPCTRTSRTPTDVLVIPHDAAGQASPMAINVDA